MLSTDDSEFGGQNRIDKTLIYYTTNEGQLTTQKVNYISLYLPARTAIVLRKQGIPNVYRV
jgi:1,4-alpha-glucan branching enzyme